MFSIETGNRGYFYPLFSRSKHSPSWTGDSSAAFQFSTRRSEKFHLSKHLKSNSTCPLQRIVHCGPATREDCRPARSKNAPTPLNHHQHPCIQSTRSPPFRTTHRHLKRTLTSQHGPAALSHQQYIDVYNEPSQHTRGSHGSALSAQ